MGILNFIFYIRFLFSNIYLNFIKFINILSLCNCQCMKYEATLKYTQIPFRGSNIKLFSHCFILQELKPMIENILTLTITFMPKLLQFILFSYIQMTTLTFCTVKKSKLLFIFSFKKRRFSGEKMTFNVA